MNKINKIINLLTIAIISFSIIAINSIQASEEVGVYSSLETDKEEVLSSEYINLKFSIHNLESIPKDEDGIALLMLYTYFDSSKFELQYAELSQNTAIISDSVKSLSNNSIALGITKNDIICKVDLNNPDFLSIEILYSLAAIESLKEDGDIFTLTFKAKEKVSGVAQFFNVDNDLGGYSYVFTNKSDFKYSIINSNSITEVEVISKDASLANIYVKSLDTNIDYLAKYKNGRYEILVPSGTLNVNVVVEANSPEAIISGNGEKTLINSSASFSVGIVAQDGITTKTYNVFIRPMKNINTLMEVQLQNGEFTDGTSNLSLSGGMYDYTLRVDYTDSLVFTLFPTTASGAKVFHNGVETSVIRLNNLEPLEENTISLDVEAEDESKRTYTFTIIMEPAGDDTSLENVSTDIDANIVRNNNTYSFFYQYSNNNKVRIMIKPTSPSTSIEFTNSTISFSKVDETYVSDEITLKSGVTSIYNIKATAKNSNVEIYTLDLFLDNYDNTSGLENIYINDIPISQFSKDKYKYDLGTFPISISKLKISVDKENEKSIVSGIGDSIDLKVGADVIIINVKSELPLYGEELQETYYYLSYYRNDLLSSDNEIEEIKVNGDIIDFGKDIYSYNLLMPYNITSVYVEVGLPNSSKNSILSGNIGYQSLVIGENILEIKITSEDLKNTSTYVISISREGPSIDTGLDKVLVDYIELELIDNKYWIEVDYCINYIYLDAIPTNEHSSIVGTGWQLLDVGTNVFKVKVINEVNTHSTEYEITIFRKLPSTNSYLNEIAIKELESFSFDKDKFTYSVNVPWEVLSITVSANTENDKAKILQNKNSFYEFKKDLSTGNNQIHINVEAEDGTISNYSLIIIRSTIMNRESSLKLLEAIDYEIFDLDDQETEIKTFNIILPYDKDIIKIKALPKSDKSMVVGSTSYILSPGLNQIDITCFAENKDYYTIYRIFVFRDTLSGNNLINKIKIEEKSDFVFDKHVESYILFFDKKINNLNLNIELIDDTASYKVIGNDNFSEGVNTIEIKVIAADNSEKVYIIFVNLESNETKAWVYSAISLGAINIGLVVFAIIKRKKLKI